MVINMPKFSKEGYGSKTAVSPLTKVGIQPFLLLYLATIYKDSFHKTFEMQISSVVVF
jgi:hypothetical protein